MINITFKLAKNLNPQVILQEQEIASESILQEEWQIIRILGE
ncbi:MAG: hypothetical protein SVM86_01030 [Candidatus Cloacimonadota bacterium]|nr:hypothetical protein [Candidatus Cloacimonadota bacterium]